jgi:hypothetical protein
MKAYYLDLFTPETWEAFRQSGAKISGFRERQRTTAERVKAGDIFICYLVRLSRWCGILEVKSNAFTDSSPIFASPDPFVVRFHVNPIVALDVERAIPIFEKNIWPHLSLTEGIEVRAMGWAQHANLRASLRQMNEADGALLTELLEKQNLDQKIYPLTAQDRQRLGQKASIRTVDRAVLVEVPDDEDVRHSITDDSQPQEVLRESHQVQAIIARMGAQMGFRIWIPKSDRAIVINELSKDLRSSFLEALPLNYDDTTLRTIEQIDVIWLKGRSMARAFEIEHTTAIYSGLLRMADLLALQPNMDIRLHIVAPAEKRDKVLREIKRPVFSLLERGPLYENCSYLAYDAIRDIAEMKYLGHMNDSIIEEYEEFAQDE